MLQFSTCNWQLVGGLWRPQKDWSRAPSGETHFPGRVIKPVTTVRDEILYSCWFTIFSLATVTRSHFFKFLHFQMRVLGTPPKLIGKGRTSVNVSIVWKKDGQLNYSLGLLSSSWFFNPSNCSSIFISLPLADELSSNRNYSSYLWEHGPVTDFIWTGLPLSCCWTYVSQCPFTDPFPGYFQAASGKAVPQLELGTHGPGRCLLPCHAIHQHVGIMSWQHAPSDSSFNTSSLHSQLWMGSKTFHFLLCSRLRLSRTEYNTWF